jgi:Flp pilus assembly protein TadG
MISRRPPKPDDGLTCCPPADVRDTTVKANEIEPTRSGLAGSTHGRPNGHPDQSGGGRRRGAVALLLAVMLPVLIGFGTLAADAAYYYYRQILLRQTVEAAALAAGDNMSSYYTTGGSSVVVTAAGTFAAANSPSGYYGTVVPASNVVLGNWNSSTSTFTSLSDSGGDSPDAVQVTGLNTAGNGNPVPLFLGDMVGIPSKDITATVIAARYGSQPFHTIMINDLSQSFASEINQQKSVDLSVLDCVTSGGQTSTRFGVVGFTGHSSLLQALLPGVLNLGVIQTVINNLTTCGAPGGPTCSGSNAAAGIYAAIQMLSDPTLANDPKNIVIVTDGVPNAKAHALYTILDGIFPTPTSLIPVCTINCTDADLLTMARNQAAEARREGISVSTIYYSGDTPPSSQTNDAAELATLRQGTGISLVAPTPAAIAKAFQAFCSTMPSALALVH